MLVFLRCLHLTQIPGTVASTAALVLNSQLEDTYTDLINFAAFRLYHHSRFRGYCHRNPI